MQGFLIRNGIGAVVCATLALGLFACGGGEETVTVTETVPAKSGEGGGNQTDPGEVITDKGAVTGYIDSVGIEGDTMVLVGWAAAADLSEPATQVSAEVAGETLAEAVPTLKREDVVEALGEPGLGESGFELELPLDSLECEAPGAGIQVMGSFDGKSSTLLFGEGIKGKLSDEC